MILKLIKFNCVSSTNDVAIRMIRSKKKIQGIIFSNLQTKGRGTKGRKWISCKGNFFASIFFELKKTLPNFKEFSLINPIILKKIITEHSSQKVSIKWPNDLLIKNMKVCGILQELIHYEKKMFLIIGIGINTTRSPITKNFKSTSLTEMSKKNIDNTAILNNLKKSYEKFFFNYKYNKSLLTK